MQNHKGKLTWGVVDAYLLTCETADFSVAATVTPHRTVWELEFGANRLGRYGTPNEAMLVAESIWAAFEPRARAWPAWEHPVTRPDVDPWEDVSSGSDVALRHRSAPYYVTADADGHAAIVHHVDDEMAHPIFSCHTVDEAKSWVEARLEERAERSARIAALNNDDQADIEAELRGQAEQADRDADPVTDNILAQLGIGSPTVEVESFDGDENTVPGGEG